MTEGRMYDDEFRELILHNVKTLDLELGRGAYGRVYEVEYCGKRCAAKEAHHVLVDEVEGAQNTIQSFLKECQRCSELRHPNIVQFLGVYYPQGHAGHLRLPAMVMEMMACSLALFVIKNHTILVDTKFSIISDVASGLSYLHSLDRP